jgi:hypothetical protein
MPLKTAWNTLQKENFLILPLLGVNRHVKTEWRTLHRAFGGVGLLNLAVEHTHIRAALRCRDDDSNEIWSLFGSTTTGAWMFGKSSYGRLYTLPHHGHRQLGEKLLGTATLLQVQATYQLQGHPPAAKERLNLNINVCPRRLHK